MTERQRTAGGRIYDQQYYAEGAVKMANEDDLSPRKTLLVFVVIVGCFAVLWPKLFYPMLIANANQHIKPSPIDKTTGCCDVISETDVNTIKIMSQLCSTIIETKFEKPPKPKEIVIECRKAVLEKCGIDISAALQERVSLGHSVKQILEEVRSLNGSLCLKYNFGVSPSKLGVPHRITVNLDSSASIRQERPSHLRSEMVHPAFRERGRAIPQPEAFKRSGPPPRIIEGRPGPVPGIRPAMGGAGHVVPSKQQHTGVMGLLMPIYTIGIVIFFTYTLMRVVFKKKPDSYASLYPPVEPDEHFKKEVFQSGHIHTSHRHTDTKLVVNAVSALLEEVDQEIRARQKSNEGDIVTNGAPVKPQEEDQPTVKVMGMETTASCEGGKKWSRPDSPVLPSSTPAPPEPQPEPQEIFLEGTLPPQSQLLVTDSATETQKEDEDSAVVLAGKMTLSVISLDSSDNGTDDSSEKKHDVGDDERGTGSSHGSDEFEKIDPYQLEEEIKDFNEDILHVSEKPIEKSDSDFSFIEAIDKINKEVLEDIKRQTDTFQGLSSNYDVLKEIKEQLKLEGDLLEVLDQKIKTEDTGQCQLGDTDNYLDQNIGQTDTSNETCAEHTKEENDTIVNPELASEQEYTESQSLATEFHTQENLQKVSEVATEKENETKTPGIEPNNEDSAEKEEENQFLSTLISISQKEDEHIAEKPSIDIISEDIVKEVESNIAEILSQAAARIEISRENNETEEKGIEKQETDIDQESEETESNANDEVLEDIQFEENINDHLVNEIRDASRHDEERVSQEHVNGNNISALQDTEDDPEDSLSEEDEDIEEIIEYVENTDEEGEEIIEVTNGVNQENQDP